MTHPRPHSWWETQLGPSHGSPLPGQSFSRFSKLPLRSRQVISTFSSLCRAGGGPLVREAGHSPFSLPPQDLTKKERDFIPEPNRDRFCFCFRFSHHLLYCTIQYRLPSRGTAPCLQAMLWKCHPPSCQPCLPQAFQPRPRLGEQVAPRLHNPIS